MAINLSYNDAYQYPQTKYDSRVTQVTRKLQKAGYFNTMHSLYGLVDYSNPLYNDNVNLPNLLLTQKAPWIIQQVLAPISAEKLIGPAYKFINWEQQSGLIPYVGLTGTLGYYSDYSPPPATDNTDDYKEVGHVRVQTGIQVGALKSAQFATLGVDLLTTKLNGAKKILDRAHNQYWWFGHKAGPSSSSRDLYGIIGNPYANSETVLQKKISPNNYTANDAQKLLNNVMTKLSDQSGGRITRQTPVVVALSNRAYNCLGGIIIDITGISALEILKKNFPNIELISCIELEKAKDKSKDYMVAFCPQIPEVSEPTGKLLYSEQMLMSQFVYQHTSQSCKISAGNNGLALLHPMGLCVFSDIYSDN